MATLSVIRRWALREQLSIREIARRTGLSRNTIKKYLRAGAAEPRYAKRISPSKLDPFAEKLSGWLKRSCWASMVHTVAWLHSHARGPRIDTRSSKPLDAAPSFRSHSAPAKRSSSTGARTGL